MNDNLEKLLKLKELLDGGLISQEEFETFKSRITAENNSPISNSSKLNNDWDDTFNNESKTNISSTKKSDSFVNLDINNGRISISCETLQEAKLALKELKLKKKEYNLIKKQIIQKQKEIRAQYTNQTRQQGSKFRGGGKIGQFIRGVQQNIRDSQRRDLADALLPLEQEKTALDTILNAIEQASIQLESQIIENS